MYTVLFTCEDLSGSMHQIHSYVGSSVGVFIGLLIFCLMAMWICISVLYTHTHSPWGLTPALRIQ